MYTLLVVQADAGMWVPKNIEKISSLIATKMNKMMGSLKRQLQLTAARAMELAHWLRELPPTQEVVGAILAFDNSGP